MKLLEIYTMENKIEILSYDLFKNGDIYYIDIPIQNIINITFTIEENSLKLFISDINQSIYLKNLSADIKQAIKDGKCFIREIGQNQNRKCFLIIC